MSNFHNNRLIKSISISCVVALLTLSNPANAQIIWNSATGTAWMSGSNWAGGSIPTTGQIAQFNANPTSPYNGVGIDMDTAAGATSAGAIYVSSARATNLIIGNNSPATAGVLSLTGASITLPNTVIANFASGNSRLTLQNTQGAGGSTLGLN
jgi:hypothetical protein